MECIAIKGQIQESIISFGDQCSAGQVAPARLVMIRECCLFGGLQPHSVCRVDGSNIHKRITRVGNLVFERLL